MASDTTRDLTRSPRFAGLISVLWALIPVLSLGLLTPVPTAHAAVKMRDWKLGLITLVYVGIWAVVGPWTGIETGIPWFALMALTSVHAFVLRRRVFGSVSTSGT
jgi:hypothetical protein